MDQELVSFTRSLLTVKCVRIENSFKMTFSNNGIKTIKITQRMKLEESHLESNPIAPALKHLVFYRAYIKIFWQKWQWMLTTWDSAV